MQAMKEVSVMDPPNFDGPLAPWVITNMELKIRVGASAYNFWGRATWMVAMSETVCVVLFDISELQANGSFHALDRLAAVLEDMSAKRKRSLGSTCS